MSDPAMMAYFRFDADDLAENRAGRISKHQRSAMLKSGLAALGAFAAMGALLGLGLAFIAIPESKVLAASISFGFFTLVGLLFLFRAVQSSKTSEARSVTGKVSFAKSGKATFMSVGGLKLPSLAAASGLFKREASYTVYYAGNGVILSAERAD